MFTGFGCGLGGENGALPDKMKRFSQNVQRVRKTKIHMLFNSVLLHSKTLFANV